MRSRRDLIVRRLDRHLPAIHSGSMLRGLLLLALIPLSGCASMKAEILSLTPSSLTVAEVEAQYAPMERTKHSHAYFGTGDPPQESDWRPRLIYTQDDDPAPTVMSLTTDKNLFVAMMEEGWLRLSYDLTECGEKRGLYHGAVFGIPSSDPDNRTLFIAIPGNIGAKIEKFARQRLRTDYYTNGKYTGPTSKEFGALPLCLNLWGRPYILPPGELKTNSVPLPNVP